MALTPAVGDKVSEMVKAVLRDSTTKIEKVARARTKFTVELSDALIEFYSAQLSLTSDKVPDAIVKEFNSNGILASSSESNPKKLYIDTTNLPSLTSYLNDRFAGSLVRVDLDFRKAEQGIPFGSKFPTR